MLRHPDTIIDEVYRSNWGRIVASLIRLVNDFDLAEEAVQEAFAAALAQWRSSGVPESPQAWIVQTARHKAIDRIRRRTRFAGISAVHCRAARAEDTDWPQILRLYDLLERLRPSPIVSLNRAVAVAKVAGPQPALALVDALTATGDLDSYHLLHATRADLLRRIGSAAEAARSYARALELATNESERRFLERRLREDQSSKA